MLKYLKKILAFCHSCTFIHGGRGSCGPRSASFNEHHRG